MEFSRFLERNQEQIKEYRKDKDIKELLIKKSEVKKIEENYELRIKYEKLKENFKNFRELWTEDDIYVVYEDFKSISKKDINKQAYLTAISLERTKKAIIWMFLHIFSVKTNLHRGKEVIKFRTKIGV